MANPAEIVLWSTVRSIRTDWFIS